MEQSITNIEINGVSYVRSDSISSPKLTGKRAVVVVDRGWIFAGDVTESNGRIKLTRAVHVLSWQSVGFSGLIESPVTAKAVLRKISDVDLPEDAEIFRVPVSDNWGY